MTPPRPRDKRGRFIRGGHLWDQAGFVSSNGHVVRHYGRALFIVSSRSRNGYTHFVDFEPNGRWVIACTCEGYKYGITRPCRHQKACAEYLLSEVLHIKPEFLEAAINKTLQLLLADAPKEKIPVISTPTKRQYQLRR